MTAIYQYLQEKSHYEDRYDLWTIEMCLNSMERWQKLKEVQLKDINIKDMTEEQKARALSFVAYKELYFIKGDQYKDRSSTISKWMERDRKLDDKLKNTKEPDGICCPICSIRMKSILKQFFGTDEPLRVLFMFECSSCQKRESFWEDGKPWVHEPERCPKCNKEVKVGYSEKRNIATWTKHCSSCGFKEAEKEDLKQKEKERKERQQREQDLLKKHRAEFCLSDKEGEEYLEGVRRLEAVAELLKDVEKKTSDPVYKEASKLTKLSVVELEKLIREITEKEKYIKLTFDKPVIGRDLIIPFSVQDADVARKEWDSVHKLQRLIKKALKDTNWRLMSEGMSYKLGYLWEAKRDRSRRRFGANVEIREIIGPKKHSLIFK